MPTFTGTTGNDYLPGTTGADLLIGLTGNDAYIVDDPNDVITEVDGEGTDRIWSNISYTLTAGSSVERLSARDAAFTTAINFTGNEITNILQGNNGDNILDGGGGADAMYGYGGNDTYYIDNLGDFVQDFGANDIAYATISYRLNGSVGTLAAIDPNATTPLLLGGSNFNNDRIVGNAGDNQLDGALGADVLRGLGGNDVYYVDQTGDVVEEAAGAGNDLVYATGSFTLSAGSEVEVIAMQVANGTTASTLTGNELNNIIFGNNGINTLNGGAGADILTGFAGNDSYVVDNLGDIIIEEIDSGSDSILTSIDWQLTGGLSVERLATANAQGTTPLSLIGNELANTIEGNAGNNFLDGGAGADTASGGAGNDTYVVDSAADVVNEAGGSDYDIVYSTVDYTLAANQAVEALAARDVSATTALALTGNNLGNTIAGNNGANVLDGKGGSDTLIGFGGADTFAFTTALGVNNVDWIFGFNAADDTIALDDAIFTGLTVGPLAAGAFVIGTAAADGDDRIIYNQTTGDLFFDADGSGSGAAVLFAHLDGAPVITVSDFTVI